ncbi:MAG: DUF2156 domain-containing protein [Bacteroidaceae bacterium]|nr:DUF2156 domain-containing protein [Bacteroidaceae bacterium]MBP9637916.1 DUF2156 domain-containing protein [Bacteroidaceae bacterium]
MALSSPIHYKEITLADREAISAFTLFSDRMNCDLSFSNLCSWRFQYQTVYAIVEDCLVLKFWIKGVCHYMMPVARRCEAEKSLYTDDGTHILCLAVEEKLFRVVNLLYQEAIAGGYEFRMLGICRQHFPLLQRLAPEDTEFVGNRDSFDYIYLRTSLASLQGKRLQSKRNHVNKFKNLYPKWTFEAFTADTITPSLIEECKIMECRWCKAMGGCGEGANGLGEERQSVLYALNNFKELNLRGGILKVDGEVVAFTLGAPINHYTFGVHVEKADALYEGAYTMINQQFVQSLPEEYVYINREEDLGLEGLRKAKLSYSPAILLEKYSLKLE